MYQRENIERFINRRFINTRGRVDFQNRPNPTPAGLETTRPATPMPVSPRMPVPRWAGAWMPRNMTKTQAMGTLGDDIPLMPATVPTYTGTATSYQLAPSEIQSSTGGGWLSNLLGGLTSIITPAAQALVATKATGYVQQQQQKTLAQTYNPGITGPAINAQAWQAAYASGSGAAPLGLSMGTLGLIAAGGLALYLIVKK